MKHPGDMMYILRFVGADVLIAAAGILVGILVTAWYFLGQRGRKDG